MRVLQGQHRQAIDLLAFGPGQLLASAMTWGDRIEVWDAATGTRAANWQAPDAGVTGLAFLPDGRLAVALAGEAVQLIDAGSGERTVVGRQAEAVESVAAAGSLLVAVVQPERPAVWPERQVARLVAWQVSPDGLAPAWEGTQFAEFSGLAVSADGRWVVSAETVYRKRMHGDAEPVNTLVVRDGPTGAEVARIPLNYSGPAARLTAFPYKQRIAAAILGLVRVWDTNSGTLLGSTRPVGAEDAAANPDGQHLVTVGEDGVVRVWGTDPLAEVRAYQWGVGTLRSVAVSWDGLLAAAGGDEGQIVVWDWDL